MSSPVPVSDITGISYRFAVKWSVPVEELRYQLSPPEISTPRILRSNIFRFKDVRDLEFSLLLTCKQNDIEKTDRQDDYEIEVGCRLGLPIFLEDALILIEDRIYRVKCKPRNNTYKGLIFDSMVLAQDKFKCESVTFHCVMSIPVKVKAVISNPTEDPSAVNIVDCESMLCDPGTYPDGYNDVSEFLFSGRIPDFNVDMAVRMISEAHRREILLLKALCLEYLMENLTAENVTTVLKQSVEANTKDLSRECVNFLSKQCKILPN